MRKLMFTLSAVNGVLNALVIAIFMPSEVIVLYGLNGVARVHGSRWVYLLFVAIPLVISGGLLLSEKFSRSSSADNTSKDFSQKNPNGSENPAIEDEEEPVDVIDEILSGKTPHADNIGMVFVWFFAIISWVMTGIALNSIENIGVILPSIIVVMFSAVMIFFTSIYNIAAPDSISGLKLKWLADNDKVRKHANRFSMYMGVMSGMLGVCLAAWSLVISNNIPNCIAIVELVLVAFVLPIVYSYILYRKNRK